MPKKERVSKAARIYRETMAKARTLEAEMNVLQERMQAHEEAGEALHEEILRLSAKRQKLFENKRNVRAAIEYKKELEAARR